MSAWIIQKLAVRFMSKIISALWTIVALLECDLCKQGQSGPLTRKRYEAGAVHWDGLELLSKGIYKIKL